MNPPLTWVWFGFSSLTVDADSQLHRNANAMLLQHSQAHKTAIELFLTGCASAPINLQTMIA